MFSVLKPLSAVPVVGVEWSAAWHWSKHQRFFDLVADQGNWWFNLPQADNLLMIWLRREGGDPHFSPREICDLTPQNKRFQLKSGNVPRYRVFALIFGRSSPG